MFRRKAFLHWYTGREVLSHALEHLLNGRAVARKSNRHLQALWRNVADRGLDVVRDPLDEVGAVLVLHVKHLLIDLLGGHAAAEQRCSGEVAAVARVGSAQ